jgi:hypothetical protein
MTLSFKNVTYDIRKLIKMEREQMQYFQSLFAEGVNDLLTLTSTQLLS